MVLSEFHAGGRDGYGCVKHTVPDFVIPAHVLRVGSVLFEKKKKKRKRLKNTTRIVWEKRFGKKKKKKSSYSPWAAEAIAVVGIIYTPGLKSTLRRDVVNENKIIKGYIKWKTFSLLGTTRLRSSRTYVYIALYPPLIYIIYRIISSSLLGCSLSEFHHNIRNTSARIITIVCVRGRTIADHVRRSFV